MNIIKTLPRLYSLARTGKITTTLYTVEQLPDGTCDIVNEHGYVDGKKQIDRRNVKTGKNIGKKNETTVQEQTIFDAKSKWNKKKDSNYTENTDGVPSADEMSLLPMLARKFKDAKHKIKYPCLVQPKLDGLRGFAQVNGDVKITSRKFKPYDAVSHLHAELKELFGELDVPVDGEIYLHGLTLEEINRRAKKYRDEITEELEFWVFDIADINKTNIARNEILDRIKTRAKHMKVKHPHIVFILTAIANCEEDVYKLHDEYVKEGYEGAIIRNKDGKYLMEKRSSDLQKYKEFEDDEFKIVDIYSGEGRETDAIIYTCEVKNAKSVKTFDVRPRGSIEMRKVAMKKGKDFYKGKELTVRYQGLTELNVPQFPVGIIIREDK